MALSVNLTGDWSGIQGNKRTTIANFDFDSSYPTGGETLTPANLGLRVIEHIDIFPQGGATFEYDYTNEKVLARFPGFTIEGAGSLTLDDYQLKGVGSTVATSIGLEASLSADTTHRFGIMPEAASTEDLSSITGVRVFAIGY
tara:strand:- start:379 stop:807 length:429 start_codon:yes stop_codon:yes gene_type:complete